jgi:radical SAM protein with 4Fe4S-binding SPASM domain
MNLFQKISFLSKTPSPAPSPGLYHYRYQDGDDSARVHLRIEDDLSGMLLVNANRVIHLNPTATHMAYFALEKVDQEIAVRSLCHLYNVKRNQAIADYSQFKQQIQDLVQPDGACPIHDLQLEIIPPFHKHPSAPYRMDLAITYRCNNNCAHCYNDRPRSYPELSADGWKSVIDRIWDIGIPHVVFTGGEPTLRHDLPELVAYAEKVGLVTGLNTNGRRLSDPDYLKKLVGAGLDHVQITIESHDTNIHDQMVGCEGAWQQTVAGIKNALNSRLYTMTNTTMLKNNYENMAETLDFLAEIGVATVGLNALIYSGHGKNVGTGLAESDLSPLLSLAQSKTEQYGQRLIWYTPTEYCQFDPMQLELGVKGCTAALYNMCIESDGSVIPCQSYYQTLGNILTDSWDSIWNHDLARSLRQREYAPGRCQDCLLLAECGGGCPLHSPSLITLENETFNQTLVIHPAGRPINV